jgi:hypothetical protein
MTPETQHGGNPRRPQVLLAGRDPKELKLTYAGNIVKHLGVQMYAGRPVPAIAELVSNSWDADAQNVEVRLTLDEPWNPGNEKQVIEVADDGDGMTWDVVRDAYLDVGRDRREAEKTDKSPGGRPLQGRKGIGKLAGFGISDVVEVQTVHKDPDPDLGERILIWFSLSLDELRRAEKGAAPVNLIYAGPVSRAPAGGRRSKGTTVVLRRLHERSEMSRTRFHRSMAQRFLLIGPKFRVTVNGEDLEPEKIKLQWKWPAKAEWAEDNIEGCGPVRYWIGFTPQPRKQNEGELSGTLLFTRGKISQEATFFEISGGVTGQHGLRYLVGMVRAEWLDGGINEPDLIATHRGAIAWESPRGQALQKWGQSLIRKYLVEWARHRAELRKEAVTKLKPEFKIRIEKLAPAYQDVAYRFVEKFQTVEMEVDEFEELLSWFLDALENATLRRIIDKLREADIADLEKVDELFQRMEIRTAVGLLQIVESNLAAIDALEKMHLEDARERGVIAKHLKKNPWLIHPTWILNKAEGRVSKWIRDEFGLGAEGAKDDKNRVDFFCVGIGGTLHIVEIKRGRYVAEAKDFLQADKYRTYVVRRFKEISDPEAIKYELVQSHLIAAELHPDAESIKNAYQDKGWVTFTNWSDLIERAKLSHHQFREELKKSSEEQEPAGE